MKAMTKNDYANKLRKAGATVRYSNVEDSLLVDRNGQRVEVFFNSDRFYDAWVIESERLAKTLRTMAAVERHLGL